MAIAYELGLANVAAAGSGAAQAEFLSNGTRRCKIREHEIFITGATASRLSIGRPANTPAGGAATVAGAQDPADAAATGGAITSGWTTAPTAPSPNMRVVDFNNVVGSGVIWTWPSDGEVVVALARTGSLLTWSLAAGAAVDMNWTSVE